LRLFSSLDRENRASAKELTEAILNIFGYRPKNLAVYKLAFCHKSRAASTNNGFRHSNERLEYLGDAILGAVVADFLFKKFPYKEEGFLTEMRSRIVSRNNLNSLSRKLGIDKLVQVNVENGTNGSSIMGDAFEAFIGAVYIDRGYDFTQKLIVRQIIQTHLDIDELMTHEINFKSKIIEWAQKEKKTLNFLLIKEEDKGKKGKVYTVELMVENMSQGCGQDYSIKKAEQRAARQACEKLMPTTETSV
jgi:ribonuclease III